MGGSEEPVTPAAEAGGGDRPLGVDSDEEHDELELEAVRGDDGIIGLDVENAVITEIVPGSFAEKAGVFRVGDRIKYAHLHRTRPHPIHCGVHRPPRSSIPCLTPSHGAGAWMARASLIGGSAK